jgi:ABC-type anion transport system duplicated permease subunit
MVSTAAGTAALDCLSVSPGTFKTVTCFVIFFITSFFWAFVGVWLFTTRPGCERVPRSIVPLAAFFPTVRFPLLTALVNGSLRAGSERRPAFVAAMAVP